MYALNLAIIIEEVTCCSCGVIFGIEKNFKQRLRDSGDSFYCPAGHGQHYTETAEKKYKREIESLEDRLRWAQQGRDSARNSLKATKGHLTRIKKRVANGVCPCCKRSFANLANHMKNQHKDWVSEN